LFLILTVKFFTPNAAVRLKRSVCSTCALGNETQHSATYSYSNTCVLSNSLSEAVVLHCRMSIS